MNCRGCNTRVPAGHKSCPHCGAEIRNATGGSGASRATVLPAPELSTARDDTDEVVDLDETADEEAPTPAPRRKSKKPAAPRKPAAPSKPEPEATPMIATDAEGLRAMLVESPELLEPGLEIYRDAEGTPLGAGYASGVGDIDLLARGTNKDLVVVMISDAGDDGEGLVAEVLQRIGWVRKHVATEKETVRGIVVCEQAPESLTYTAAAVADTVRFKTFRVALTFSDLEL